MLDKENHFSSLAMIVYSYKEDKDLDEWMMEYAEKNDMYYMNQKKNYLHMKNDLNRFIEDKKRIYEEV